MVPLRREVEPARPSIGPWVPIALLGTTLVMVLAMGVAVTAERPSRIGTKMRAASAAPVAAATAREPEPTKLFSAADIHALARRVDEARDEPERRRWSAALARACEATWRLAGPHRPVAEQAAARCNALFRR